MAGFSSKDDSRLIPPPKDPQVRADWKAYGLYRDGYAVGYLESFIESFWRLDLAEEPDRAATLRQIEVWIYRCDGADADWILSEGCRGTFADFKVGLEDRLKVRGVL